MVCLDRVFPGLRLTKSQIYIGRDSNPNLDELVSEAARRARVPIKEKLSKAQLSSVSPILQQLHHEQFGKNCHAFYAWAAGSSHSKILVLVYPTFLRVVITSCNMMDVDTEINDNHWYIHDLPKLPSRSGQKTTGFEADLLSHLRALGTPEEFVSSIEGIYDYSGVKVHLVTSVPGTHSKDRAQQYGLLRLRRVLQELGLNLEQKRSAGDLRLEICTASLGNLSAEWLTGFVDCAMGTDLIKAPEPGIDVPEELKLFYPTNDDVMAAESEPQPGAANISCHTRPWLTTPHAIRNLFHHYHSKDTGRIFHQKLIMAYNHGDMTTAPYYVYVGSANLSQSAWGSLEKDKRGNKDTCDLKLSKMLNFECGVVVPGHLIESLLEPGTPTWQDGIVPYVQTAERYVGKDRPWNDPSWVRTASEDVRPVGRPCRFLHQPTL